MTGERWQWARSEDETTWTEIQVATSPRRGPEPEDVGMYLRATATYSDKFGPGKTASVTTANRVEARTLANGAPHSQNRMRTRPLHTSTWRGPSPITTTLGMNVGSTASATDADADMLFYELLDTPDLRDAAGTVRFTIDSLSGQIRVGKALGADSCNGHPSEREDEDSRSLTEGLAPPPEQDHGFAGNGNYVLWVRASDPSTATATLNVIVTVADANEPPRNVESAPMARNCPSNTSRHSPPCPWFGPGRACTASARIPPTREVQHPAVPLVIALLIITPKHHHLGVVVQTAPRHPAEVVEGVQVTPNERTHVGPAHELRVDGP